MMVYPGEMAERLKATVSKTVVGVSSTKGSNPFLSATLLGNGLVNGLTTPAPQLYGGNSNPGFDRLFDRHCSESWVDVGVNGPSPSSPGHPYSLLGDASRDLTLL
jgi:hypothetical protein